MLGSLQNDAGLHPIGGIATVRYYCFNCKLLKKERACQLMAPLPEYSTGAHPENFKGEGSEKNSISHSGASPENFGGGRDEILN